jgi:hypothetical protein
MNTIIITNNEYGTFFISLNGQEVADSSSIRRVRGFWNKVTKEYTVAKEFTKKNILRNPFIVLDFLNLTGTDTTTGLWNVEVNLD